MKKKYINPNIKVVIINTSKHMLAGSDQTMAVQGDYESGMTIGSRRNSIWDDDEE